jgi:hypothetical protein
LDNDGAIGIRAIVTQDNGTDIDVARFMPVGIMRDTIDGIWWLWCCRTRAIATNGVPVV